MLERYGLWLRRFFARKEAGSHFVVGLHTQLLVYIFAERLSDVPQFLLQAFMRGSQLFCIGSIMEVAKDRGGPGMCPGCVRDASRPVSRAPFGGVSRMCPRCVRTVFLMVLCILARVRKCPVVLGCCVPYVSQMCPRMCPVFVLGHCCFLVCFTLF